MVYVASAQLPSLYRAEGDKLPISKHLQWLSPFYMLATHMSIDAVNGRIYWSTGYLIYGCDIGERIISNLLFWLY